jgi:hypothetical protein
LGLIALGLLKLTSASVFPGKNALWPTVGAALLIAAGRGAWVNRVILSNKIMVGIGLISYPLYLWHWPLLSLARIIEQETPSRAIRVGAVGLSFVLAILTFYALEKPLRRVTALGKKAAVLFVLLMLTAFLGWNVYKSDGYGFRDGVKSPIENINFKSGNEPPKDFFNSILDTIQGHKNTWDYQYQPLNPKEGIIFIGDSHSLHLNAHLNLLDNGYRRIRNIAGYGVVSFKGGTVIETIDDKGVYHPFVNLPIFNAFDNFRYNAEILKDYKVVVLSSYWQRYSEQFNFIGGQFSYWYNGKVYAPGDFGFYEDNLRDTLSYLTTLNKTIIINYNVPSLIHHPKNCVTSRPWTITALKKVDCEQTKKAVLERQNRYRSIFNKVLQDYPNVKIFDPLNAFCDDSLCYYTKNNQSLYFDDNHLSVYGSELFMKAFKAKFPELFAP